MMMEAGDMQKSFLFDVLLPKVEKISLLVTLAGLFLALTQVGSFEGVLIVGLQTLAITCFLRAFKPLAVDSDDEPNFPLQYFNGQNLPVESLDSHNFWMDTLAPKILNIAGACVIVGILFKIEFWKGADLQIAVGEFPLVLFVFLMALRQQIDRRAVLITTLGGLMLSVSSETLMRQLHSDDPQLVELMVNQLHHPNDRGADQAVRTHINKMRHQR